MPTKKDFEMTARVLHSTKPNPEAKGSGRGVRGGAVSVVKVLSGHVSPETAYTVADYPYGFRLRCQIRYWLEFTPKRGVRLVSQTSNPKLSGLVWNKPKASTYCKFGGAMYLDENNHVEWSGLHEYTDATEAAAWRDTYGAGVPADCVPLMNAWCEAKRKYEAARDAAKAVQS